jgi:hypothetical protein
MGAAKNHRQAFLNAHSRCAFCAGKVEATTIEHCPPRAMFQHRHWPEGLEFPACVTCNQGSGDHDLLIAMLARMDPFEGKSGNKDGKLDGLLKMVNKQYPGLFSKMKLSATEARRHNRELGLQPAPGQTHQEASGVRVPDEIHKAVCVFARKLAKAIFYKEVGTVFPDDGCLLLNWFTNADLFRSGKYVVFDLLKELGGKAPPLERSGKYLNDQFEYKTSLSPEKEFLILQARFGNAFGLVVFGSTLPDRLEAIVARIREQTERDGPFAVLQSTSLS